MLRANICLFCAIPHARSFSYLLSFILSFVMTTWWGRYYYAYLEVKWRLRVIQWQFRGTASIWTLILKCVLSTTTLGWFIKPLPVVHPRWKFKLALLNEEKDQSLSRHLDLPFPRSLAAIWWLSVCNHQNIWPLSFSQSFWLDLKFYTLPLWRMLKPRCTVCKHLLVFRKMLASFLWPEMGFLSLLKPGCAHRSSQPKRVAN